MENSSVRTLRDNSASKPSSSSYTPTPSINQSLQNITDNLIRIYGALGDLDQKQKNIEESVHPILASLDAVQKTLQDISIVEIETEETISDTIPTCDKKESSVQNQDVTSFINRYHEKIAEKIENQSDTIEDHSEYIEKLSEMIANHTSKSSKQSQNISNNIENINNQITSLRTEITTLQYTSGQIQDNQTELLANLDNLTDVSHQNVRDIREDITLRGLSDIEFFQSVNTILRDLLKRQDEIIERQEENEGAFNQISGTLQNISVFLENLSKTTEKSTSDNSKVNEKSIDTDILRSLIREEMESYKDAIIKGVTESTYNPNIQRCLSRTRECAKYTGTSGKKD